MPIRLNRVSFGAWRSPTTYMGPYRAIYGRQPAIQREFNEVPLMANPSRHVFRFLGPSGFPKDDKTQYMQRVGGILDQIISGLESVKDRVEISTGVSNVGLDSMLAKKFMPAGFHVSGVVCWGLPKLTFYFKNQSEPLILSVGSDWSGYDRKMQYVQKIFSGLQTLIINGPMPQEGIEIIEPDLNVDGKEVSRLLVERNDGTDFTDINRMAIYGNNWGGAYDLNRPYLSGVVVLGGGPICRMEALAALQNLGSVMCIAKDILPENHNLGKKNEMPSASVFLTQPEYGFKLPEFTVEQIIEEIKRIVNARYEIASVNIRYPVEVR